ncbi:enoyl-CoA hydratase/isomerase family protein [bacterium]|nr:enoyl-CoA hydratase/isomerase family protein [bacterium]MBU1637866.1 enoyl-CoA hydratase/isomerase family protein [bacterium]MBU1919813.1 enoyl-CoA hydratase/isomerase family protein [bacterium]
MNFETLLIEKDGPMAIVTVNRPKALNALNILAFAELKKCFEALREDETVRVAIITGAGEKSFVAGADITEIAAMDMAAGRDLSYRGNIVFSMIEAMPFPVIAAVNGFALGGGCELTMACHIRVASDKAKFGQPEINLGLTPGYGGTQRLPRLIGRGRALDLLLTGRMITAKEAFEWGLVNYLTTPEELMDTAKKIASGIAEKSSSAVRSMLEAVHTGINLPLDQAIQVEVQHFAYCNGTEDKNEGTRAFMEKRKPEFKGR